MLLVLVLRDFLSEGDRDFDLDLFFFDGDFDRAAASDLEDILWLGDLDGEVEFVKVGVALVSFFSGLAAHSESFGVAVEGSSDTSTGTSGAMLFWEDLVSDGSVMKGTGSQDPLNPTALKPGFEMLDAVSDGLVSEFTVGLCPFSVVS